MVLIFRYNLPELDRKVGQVLMPRETRKKTVLKAAALFAAKGFAAVSVSQLARRAGLSKLGIYYHVRDKEELHTKFYWQHPHELAILFSQKGFLSPGRRRRVVAMEREYLDLFRGVIREGQRRRVFRRVDPTVAAFSFFAMLNTLDGWYDPRGRIGPDELVVELERLYFDGLAAPARKRRPGAATRS